MPPWADIPFYRASSGDRRRGTRRPWLWETSDRDDFNDVLASPKTWSDVFDAKMVKERWSETLSGRGIPRDEALFYRVAAKHFFLEHIERLRRAASNPVSQMETPTR
jgi:hypothetical protein